MTQPVPMASAVDQISYDDLYARWEKGNWSATAIDFSVDREHWFESFDEHRRRAALWNYSLFLHGEDSVADNLSPYIDAAPREEQKYFLTTQQVDEARHAVFFGRFMREVVGAGPDSYADALRATEPELNWGFRQVFGRLDRMADELRRDRSRTQLAKAITLYHIVVEATLAQPGQHFIDGYLEREGYLPGFASGMRNVALDEQRHIAFGVKLLHDLVREDPECKDAMKEMLGEALPWTLAVFIPPGWDDSYITTFGTTREEVAAEGVISLETKLRMIGFDADDIQSVLPMPLELEPIERARRSYRLVRAGFFGEKTGPPSREPEEMALLFDSIRLSAKTRAANVRPATIQWDFADAEPWYLRIANGSTETVKGRAQSPDLTLSCRWEDWVDVVAGREDPRVQMLRRRIRPKGSIRVLLSMPKVFPQRGR